MKRKLFSLMTLLLTVCSGAWADVDLSQGASYDFTRITKSSISDNLGEPAYWSWNNNGYYANTADYAPSEATAFMVNSTSTIDAFDGLNVIIGSNGRVRIYVDTSEDGSGKGLYFNSSNAKLVFPGLKKDQVITIAYTNVSGDEAQFTVTNASADQNTETHVETLTVTGDGDVTLTYNSKKFYIKTIEITPSKTITSKVLTGININGTPWDISGLSDGAATITAEYNTIPTVQFVYTINYSDDTSDEGQTENVVAVKDEDNYVATSTALTANVSLTFTNVNISKEDAGLAYAISSVNKKIPGATFTNTLTNPHNVAITYSISSNGTGSTINESTGEVTVGATALGSETITATFAGSDLYNEGTATYTLVVAEGSTQTSVSGLTTWLWDNVTPGDQITNNVRPTIVLADEDRLDFSGFGGPASAVKLTNCQRPMMSSNNRKCAQSGGFVLLVSKGGIVTIEASGNNTNARALYVNGSKVKEYNSGSIFKVNVPVSAGTVTAEFKEGEDATLGRIYSLKFTPTTTVTTNAGNWASFTPEWNCTLEDGAKAYIITAVNGSTLTGEEVAVLEGGKGYFIKGEVASHAYTATATDADATSTEGNLVVGCATNTNIDGDGNTKYILGSNASGAGLFYVDSSITIPAGKAYLDAGKVIDAPARALSLDFEEGETTAINAALMNNERTNNEVYNLNGQRVAQPTKGLYIVNGRKVVIR